MRAGPCTAICAGILVAGMPAASIAQSAPPARYDWSGLYIGAHLGGGLELTDVGNPYGSSIYGNTIRAPGPIAGGQTGYNWQHDHLVFGVEADVSWADLYGTETCFAYSGFFVSSDCTMRSNVFGTLSGRAGFLVGPDAATLIYGKAGAAWVHTDVDASPGGGLGFPATASSGTQWGWTLGAGIERAISSRWSWKAEYDFASMHGNGLSTPASGFQAVPSGDPNALVAVPSAATRYSPDLHLLKVGLNYRLSAPSQSASWVPEPLNTLPGSKIEVGLRYVYGWSRFQKDLGIEGTGLRTLASRLTYDDNHTNGSEVFARLDTSFGLMVKGFAGWGDGDDGKLNDEDWGIPFSTFVPYSNTYSKVDNEIRYGVIDAGYELWNNAGLRAAPFVGYSIFKQNMTGYGCFQIVNGNSDCAAAPIPFSTAAIREDDRWQALRLGVAADFEILPGITISADVAYLPYVRFDGTDDHILRSLLSPEWANGTGTQLELIVNYALTDALKIGIGGRYWAMWTDSGVVNFGGQELVPMRYTVEQAALLVQGSYTFDFGAY